MSISRSFWPPVVSPCRATVLLLYAVTFVWLLALVACVASRITSVVLGVLVRALPGVSFVWAWVRTVSGINRVLFVNDLLADLHGSWFVATFRRHCPLLPKYFQLFG